MGYIDDIIKAASQNLPWDKLSGTNILITGSTGLIGSCLVEVLMAHPSIDYHIYASGRNEERVNEVFGRFLDSPFFHFFKYDVINPLECNIDFHYVIHAASNASPYFFASKPVEVIKANVFGVVNLLDYGRCHNLRRLLYVSSGEVYGEGDGRSFTEDYSGYVDNTSPRSCYPSSKRTSETLCVSYGSEYGLDTVIARPCHIYGPHFTEKDNRVYAQFIRNILSGNDIVMKSDGAQMRSWCYVVDCVSALLYILLKGKSSHAYNIADEGSNITIKSLAEIIARIGNRKVIIDTPSVTEKSGYNVVSKSLFVTEKLKALGWEVQSSIESNLKSTIEYVMSNKHVNDNSHF